MADGAAQAPDGLICPAHEIFDTAAVAAALDKALKPLRKEQTMRQRAVEILLEAKNNGFKLIGDTYLAHPRETRAVTASYTYLTDQIVTEVMRIAVKWLQPEANRTAANNFAMVAVGGYGRAEMAPYSDVDLLFVIPAKSSKWAEKVVEAMLYVMWDLKLKVGHSTRTTKDCLRLGKEDFTIRTALLECRFLAGHRPLYDTLDKSLRNQLFKSTGPEFVEAKLRERAERHRKQGGQRYMVEPNVKEGKGGLRDLQTLYWIAKYLHGAHHPAELVALGVYTQDEYDKFVKAETFLWTVRCHLHLIAGRAVEHLTFDAQVGVAKVLGYKDRGGRRSVEHFMQAYFRHATRVGELTRVFLTSLEAQHVKRQPRVSEILWQAGKRLRTRLAPGFKLVLGRISIVDDEVFLADPLNLLRIFEEALRTGYFLHPDAMRLLAANLDRYNEDLQNDPEASRIFLDLMLEHGNPERALRRMNELGVLGAFVPEFQAIVAMMQFNMYHHYTVDEHTIQCISTLAQIERGDLVEDLPVASGILKAGVNRRVIFVALLLHDVGKGRDEDHSELGAKIAESVCPRLGLNPDETETVVWLVKNHLLMSDVAQKRDLSDVRTVRDFANIVSSPSRLKLLTVLTVCDIRGVGPGTWNNWKAQLLRTLYHATHRALTSGMDTVHLTQREDEARDALRSRLKSWDKAAVEKEIDRHYPPYWVGLDTDVHVIVARLLKDIKDDDISMDLKPDGARDATRAAFAMQDHPGIFSRLAGALALVGANVVDARTYTSSDGMATAVFWVQDSEGKPYEKSRLTRLRNMIRKTLAGEVVAREALKDRDKIKKRERDFIVPTEITFDNDGSGIYTIVEVDTRDRPGLLYDLALAMSAANIYIASAVIATYGAQVVDVFYVKDMFGHKIHAKSKRDGLQAKLLKAINVGAAGALK